jgi:DNA primase
VARVPEDEIARIKSGVSVARLAEAAGVALRPQGQDLIGCCPFHDDTVPSLVISPAANLWHCLGACQAGGSVIDWVMRSHGVSFRHAVELLRSDAPALSSPPQGAARSRTVKLPPLPPAAEDAALLAVVTGFYHDALAGSADAAAFLHRRKIADPEAAEFFRLGFADRTLGYRLPRSRTLAGDEVRSRLRRLGILRESGHEHFRGSLVIPVIDGQGQVGEIYGRKVRTDLHAGTPLHLYLPGPHRGVLNPAAFTAAEVIVCEAVIDAITLWCAGFRHVTASYGTGGWTAEHTALIREHRVSRVLIAYDGDPAGDAGACSLAAELSPLGVECLRVPLPEDADVNDIAVASRSPRDALGVLLRHAVPAGHKPAPAKAGMQRARDPAGRPDPARYAGAVAGAAQAVQAGSGARPEAPSARDTGQAPPAGSAGDHRDPPVLPGAGTGPAGPDAAGGELVMVLDDRRWRVRGLDKATSHGALRVNLLAARGERLHIDTLDLYSARARQAFTAAAAAELGVSADVVKADLGKILLASETAAERSITAARQPARTEPAMTDAERSAALELLRDPGLAGRITADFATAGIAGEAAGCLALYLAAVSRKLDRPLAVIVQSSSAAGKSALMDAALAFVPPEDKVTYSAMTGQSLFYLGQAELAHKVLAVAEEEGASRASYALKLLQSEGQLSIASTGKDPDTGTLVTRTYQVSGPAAIMLTTTSIEVDEELMNRCLVLAVDEDREQTRAIHAAQRHARTLDGLAARTRRDQILAVHRNAQRLIEPVTVINPFADRLTFPDARTRTRRDHGKYLTLIDAVTLLHQHQRARKTVTIAGTEVAYIETTPADIAIANQLAHEILGRSLDELPPVTRRILDAISGYVMTEAGRQHIPPARVRFTRRQLREATGSGDTQLKMHLARLADLELLTVHRGEHGSYSYALSWRGEGTDGTPFLPGLTDPATLAHNPGRSASGTLRSAPAKIGSPPGRPPAGGQSAPGQDSDDQVSGQLTGRLHPFGPVITPARMDTAPVNGSRVMVIDPPVAGGEQ